MINQALNKEKIQFSGHIGIDLLGCDIPGEKLLEGIVRLFHQQKKLPQFTVFATKEIFNKVEVPSGINCRVVSEEILADEDPLVAVRKKKDSSISVGISLLKNQNIDAFISAGNTGALLAIAKMSLLMLPGIERPALLTLIPTKLEPVAVLDVGANVHVSAENLFQFAQMGIAYQKTRGVNHPNVGLLNIGEEKQKGTPELRKAYEILQNLNKNSPKDQSTFIGNIEGRDVFRGNIDVLITDGFVGNIFLKTAEGIAGFVLDQMQDLGPIESLPWLKSIISTLRARLHYAEHPGAILCGIDGIVMKCHGASTQEAFVSSIRGCTHLIKNCFLEKLKKILS